MDKDGGFLAETIRGCEAYSIFTLAFSYLFFLSFFFFEAVCTALGSTTPSFLKKKQSVADLGGSLHVRRLLK